MDVSEAIAKRRSVRAYLDKEVPSDDLARIVEAGRWAPNAGTFQIAVIRNPELRQRINDHTLDAMIESGIELLEQRASLPGYQPLYGAPALLLLSAPADAPHGVLNAALAAENMILEATGLGLGSCFLVSPNLALNGEENRTLAREVGIPEGHVLKCAIILGYHAPGDRFSAGKRERKGVVIYVD